MGVESGTKKMFYPVVYAQKKMERVMSDALQRYYRKRETEKIKLLLNEFIRKTHEEIWSYGTFDLNDNLLHNWGVNWIEKEKRRDVRLFDVGELIDCKEDAIQKLPDFWENIWVICPPYYHPECLREITDKNVAGWFMDRVREEFTIDKLNYYWCKKISSLQPKSALSG